MRRLLPLLSYCFVQRAGVCAFRHPFNGRFFYHRRRVAFLAPSRSEAYYREKSATTIRRGESSLRQTLLDPSSSADNDERAFGAGTDWTADDTASLARWEKLWLDGKNEKREEAGFTNNMAIAGGSTSGSGTEVNIAMPVEIMSFDLDNTLWATKGVIDNANNVLQDHLQREHPALVMECSIPDLMKEIWKERSAVHPEVGNIPVDLTELRKAALTRACERTGTDPSSVIESSFAIWHEERLRVKPYMFPGVLETLAALKERGIRLVAITNGNADTDSIPCLNDFFEFCVMAEQVGERKPDAGPFRAAIQRAGFPSEEHVGGQWVHVGDDWSSDCVGAKAMRMRTILVTVPGEKKMTDRDEPVALDEEEEEKANSEEAQREEVTSRIGEVQGMSDQGPIPSANEIPQQEVAGISGVEKIKALEELGLTVEKVADGSSLPPSGIEMPQKLKDAVAAQKQKQSQQEIVAASANTIFPEPGLSKEQFVATVSAAANGEQDSADSLKGVVREPYLPPGAGYYQDVVGGPDVKVMKSMGSGTYLADMIMNDFMDMEAARISDVVEIVDEWNRQYEERQAARSRATAARGPKAATTVTATATSLDSNGSKRLGDGVSRRGATESKFCIDCGTRIPKIAKFCPECGVKQETVAAL